MTTGPSKQADWCHQTARSQTIRARISAQFGIALIGEPAVATPGARRPQCVTGNLHYLGLQEAESASRPAIRLPIPQRWRDATEETAWAISRPSAGDAVNVALRLVRARRPARGVVGRAVPAQRLAHHNIGGAGPSHEKRFKLLAAAHRLTQPIWFATASGPCL